MERLCSVDELPEGSIKSFMVGPTRVVAIHSRGVFRVLRDSCAHQGAPLSDGRLTGTMLPSEVGEYHAGRLGEILRCPWHAWEYDIHTGRSLHDPDHDRVRSYRVEVRDGSLFMETARRAPAGGAIETA